jgi:hypothetical protein
MLGVSMVQPFISFYWSSWDAPDINDSIIIHRITKKLRSFGIYGDYGINLTWKLWKW